MFTDLLGLLSLLFNVILRIICLITGPLIALSSMGYVEQNTIRFITVLFFGIWLTFQAVTKNGPYKVLFMIGALFGWIFGSFKYSNTKR